MASSDSSDRSHSGLPEHEVRAGPYWKRFENAPDPSEHRSHIEPWLSALLQAEHLNLLIGSGFTTAIATSADVSAVDLSPVTFKAHFANAVERAAAASAQCIGRNQPNFEDQIRSVVDLIAGLRIIAYESDTGKKAQNRRKLLNDWTAELDGALLALARKILEAEREIEATLKNDPEQSEALRRLLGGFLLPFASRAATRERTHIFTTNYDRLIEYACDLLGLRIVDRFIGALAPVFHSSRLGVDLHYNPPGIRGEPRYLEGVVRLTKLHGSVDWRSAVGPSGRHEVQRATLPFGASEDHPDLPVSLSDQLLIYPNAAKDVETLEFPYADLFRDLAAAVCRPNAVVVTYGFGFGDDHVNRVLRDALTIPSTHLVIISYDDANGRVQAFLSSANRKDQITLLLGPHFGDLSTLVEHYLPQPAIDQTLWRMVDLLDRRTRAQTNEHYHNADRAKEDEAHGQESE